MKYFFDSLPEIDRKMQENDSRVLISDFDGTLSKIAETSNKAFIEKTTKNLLKKVSENFNVVIVSGRALSDVKSKVGLKNIIYAGNHGLEWQINGKCKAITVPPEKIKLLVQIKNKYKNILINYPGAFLEDKKLSIAIHYRLLSKYQASNFIKESNKIISEIDKKKIKLLRDKKTEDFRPELKWTKGEFVKFILKNLGEKNESVLPFYIGDSETDEDAFKAISSGVTIRIGKNKNSSVKYYIKPGEINKLLSWIIAPAGEGKTY